MGENAPAKVLIVEDNEPMSRLIASTLRPDGYEVTVAGTQAEGLKAAESKPDVLILDMLLPDGDGNDVIREVTKNGHTKIICLTGVTDETAIIEALELGADDYITKPFNPEELTARIRAVLRRTDGTPDERIVRTADVEIDLNRRLVKKGGNLVQLTNTEWRLILQLGKNPNKTIQSAELLRESWGPEFLDDLQYLRVWVSRLRKKIEDDPRNPQIIQTFGGVGYRLNAPDLA